MTDLREKEERNSRALSRILAASHGVEATTAAVDAPQVASEPATPPKKRYKQRIHPIFFAGTLAALTTVFFTMGNPWDQQNCLNDIENEGVASCRTAWTELQAKDSPKFAANAYHTKNFSHPDAANNEFIQNVQIALNAAGTEFHTGTPDGVLGPTTNRKIAAFAEAKGLEGDDAQITSPAFLKALATAAVAKDAKATASPKPNANKALTYTAAEPAVLAAQKTAHPPNTMTAQKFVEEFERIHITELAKKTGFEDPAYELVANGNTDPDIIEYVENVQILLKLRTYVREHPDASAQEMVTEITNELAGPSGRLLSYAWDAMKEDKAGVRKKPPAPTMAPS